MPKNPISLNPQFPPPTYEETYKTYLSQYKDTMIPNMETTYAYHTFPTHVRSPPKDYVPHWNYNWITYEDFKQMKEEDEKEKD